MRPTQTTQKLTSSVQRIRLWHTFLLVAAATLVIRAFYLQVIKHTYYEQAALAFQLKNIPSIPAKRGAILAHNYGSTTPLVLNEVRYTVFADPGLITDPSTEALAVQKVIGGNASDYQGKMETQNSRYERLATQVTKDKSNAITDLKLKGVGTTPSNYRTYPQGNLAAQVLGFVNDDGQGTYGVEQALDQSLRGTPGQLKAITDASGVPLAANEDNIDIDPIPGKDVLLTLDLGMQSQLEDILRAGLKQADSSSGGALILDANTGAIKAMANYPTYSPANFAKVSDANLFTNPTVSSPLEIGSVMKPFTAAAALDQGVVNANTTYYDPSHFKVDDYTITNIEEDGGAGTRSIADILQLSLNTGATWLLMQMGGGEINQQAREAWHGYMVDHYQLGKTTGVEQGYEAAGTIPDPTHGYGLNIQYANTAFGQGMTATPLQVGAALAAVVNGGTYYQPRLVDAYIDTDGNKESIAPTVVRRDVVKSNISHEMVGLMQNVIAKNYYIYHMDKPNPAFIVGGKTGTAQIANPAGGYYEDRFNGMFIGFVGGNQPQYIIVVRVNQPHIAGYAGSQAAAPIFGHLVNMLINNFGVNPRT